MPEIQLSALGAAGAVFLWFMGPLLWVLFGRLKLGAPIGAAVLGSLTFLVAWCGSVLTSAVLASSGVAAGSAVWILCISLSAGVCEESARYGAYRFIPYLRRRLSWETGAMHTFGHAGIESVIEGITILGTIAAATLSVEQIPSDALADIQAAAEMTSGVVLFTALSRLVLGPIIHGAFASFCAAAVHLQRPGLWLGAIAFHALHDVAAYSVGGLHDYAPYVWLAFLLVAYPPLIRWLRRRWWPAPESAPVAA